MVLAYGEGDMEEAKGYRKKMIVSWSFQNETQSC